MIILMIAMETDKKAKKRLTQTFHALDGGG